MLLQAVRGMSASKGTMWASVAISIIALMVAGSSYLIRPSAPVIGPTTHTFTVTAREFSFDVTGDARGTNPTIRVKIGDLVKITFKNGGGLAHEFMIVEDKDDAIGTEKGGKEAELPFGFEIADVDTGQERTVTFIASHSGDFFYVCLEDAGTAPKLHAENGMFGQFIVEP